MTAAEEMLRSLLADRDTLADRLCSASLPHVLAGEGLNPEWLLVAMQSAAVSAQAYLLAVLWLVAPDVADPVAAWLASAQAEGEPLDELAVQMHEQIKAGARLILPAVSG